MVQLEQTPLQSVWDRLDSSLQDALYGTFIKHGIISTRKAFAALEGVNERVKQTFQSMEKDTVIPLEGQHASPNSSWRKHENFFATVQCSPCVNNACNRLSKETEGSISSTLFFSYLVETSCGPTVKRWRKDGYDPERIIRIFSSE